MTAMPDRKRSRAVLVGTARYANLENLPAVSNNLDALKHLLADPRIWGLDPDCCMVIEDPRSPSDVLGPLRQAAAEATDTLLVYYAGHGLLDNDDGGELCLALVDSAPEFPETLLQYHLLRRTLRNTRAKRKLVILDSCYSGKAMGVMANPAQALASQAGVAGVYLICSAAADRHALAHPGERFTAFTAELVDVLAAGIEDGPELISLDAAFEHIRNNMVALSRPRPQRQARDDIGALALARNQWWYQRHVTQPARRDETVQPGHSQRPAPHAVAPSVRDLNLISQRYELGSAIGYGETAEVYRGRDMRVGREVAVKTLRADLARDPTFLARFRREAQSLAALNHPAIVSVYDTGEDVINGSRIPFIVMEFIEGRTLRDVLQTEVRFTERRAMEITSDVCAALDYSHRMGIIHRDIKPANVMLCPDGSVKVMDFGIARATTATSSNMTATSAVIGTAQYLSPEQARGSRYIDARSDVYTTGVLLYELLAGLPPFRGDNPVAVAYQHVKENPEPPSYAVPSLSPEADAIVFKAMEKNPDDRYLTAGEMRDDLERALAGRRIVAPFTGGTTTRRSSYRWTLSRPPRGSSSRKDR